MTLINRLNLHKSDEECIRVPSLRMAVMHHRKDLYELPEHAQI